MGRLRPWSGWLRDYAGNTWLGAVGLVRAIWGDDSDLVVEIVEGLGLRTVDLVPPAAREALLVEDGAVGTHVSDPSVVVADGEHLAASLRVRVVAWGRGRVRYRQEKEGRRWKGTEASMFAAEGV